MHFQIEADAFQERNRTIIFSFAIVHIDLTIGKIDILDTQAKAFHKPKSGTEKELYHTCTGMQAQVSA